MATNSANLVVVLQGSPHLDQKMLGELLNPESGMLELVQEWEQLEELEIADWRRDWQNSEEVCSGLAPVEPMELALEVVKIE